MPRQYFEEVIGLVPPIRPAARVEVMDDVHSLGRVIPAWEDLAANAMEPNPLYEPWMLLPALRASPSRNFRCLLVWNGGGESRPLTLGALFVFETHPGFRGLPVKMLRSWRHRSWMLGTPLVRKETARECLIALLGWARATEEGASLLEFQYLPVEGAFHDLLADVLLEQDLMAVSAGRPTRAFLKKADEPAQSPDSMLSSGLRKSLRRKERRLAELGRLSHVALGPRDDPQQWIEQFLRLEAAGWKGRRGSALACRDEDRRFVTEMLLGAFARGRLQIVGLDLDGRPIARCCNLIAGEGAYAYRCAYDEDFAGFSPGVMAEVDSMQAFHDDPRLRWMDSLTSPDNETLNRLWKQRRTLQTLLVGLGAWGELWISTVPLLRWAKRRMRPGAKQAPAMDKAVGSAMDQAL